ncbi:hypothetical protein [Bacteroides reticulotermitis]|nr:hypothetical protein [Bacteroides reticulotermitis]MBB4044711.1 hypothetical protein [Bacteroides reticulotermitis]
MKYIYIIFILSLFYSCSQEEHTSISVNDTYIDMYVTDKDGNDLLNPESKNDKNVDLNKLTLTYLINNKEIVYYKKDSDAPNGFMLLPPNADYNKYILRIFPNATYDKSISYLKWDISNVDTISIETNKTNSSTICVGVELNGKKVWGVGHQNEDKDRRLITIIK